MAVGWYSAGVKFGSTVAALKCSVVVSSAAIDCGAVRLAVKMRVPSLNVNCVNVLRFASVVDVFEQST